MGRNFSTPDCSSLPEEYGWPTTNESGYRLREEACGTGRPLRIIALGAGFSGINLAHTLPSRLKNITLKIYEKNPEYGGTCYFHMNHLDTGAYWNNQAGVWEVHIKNLASGEAFVECAEVFINSGGLLNAWKWPDIEGLFDYKGLLCHTANYDPSIDLQGKRVAVLGIGSSGVQIIPSIADKVFRLYTWIRSPTWITTGFAQKFAGPRGANFDYTEEQKRHYQQHPEEYLKYCKELDEELSQNFAMILTGTPEAKAAADFSKEEMKKKLGHRTDLANHLIPTEFGVGCRRPTPGNGFLEALTTQNVTTFLQPMQRITKNGFIDSNGSEHEVDVIICATGFDTSWVPRFPVVANGNNVQDIQRKRPVSYLSLAVPNNFVFHRWNGNRFNYLGNGFSITEFEGSDTTWYMGTKENPGSYLPEDTAQDHIITNGSTKSLMIWSWDLEVKDKSSLISFDSAQF
ncbi:hypothetical protein FE257_001709 [Aspergillus nanangensis]|uniref:Uncharacterized protein n=1 Tax=Aspergillus nanangensis TaxID=2582783 RepID=A0AAD4CDK8_ASPNN|nr:hypothetical protein FE257_001709 [Aspergillus nanangensis]